MTHTNWEAILEKIDDDLLLEAMYHRPSPGSKLRRRVVTLAALLALLCALGFTACAANLFGIRDMLMEVSSSTYITIAGYQESAEYLALQEWETQCPKRQNLKGPVSKNPVYHQYGAYTAHAKQLLDNILEKYELQPYSQWIGVYDGDPQSLYDAIGIGDFLPESCAAFRGTVDPDISGCSVRNGGTIFSFSDSTLLPDGTQVNYELNNSAKGYLPIFIGFRIDPDSAQEWQHKAKDGTRVLLCTDKSKSLILADLPGSFLSISSSVPLSKDTLENFADLFSYDVIAKTSLP